jgi:hypothetical protein
MTTDTDIADLLKRIDEAGPFQAERLSRELSAAASTARQMFETHQASTKALKQAIEDQAKVSRLLEELDNLKEELKKTSQDI